MTRARGGHRRSDAAAQERGRVVGDVGARRGGDVMRRLRPGVLGLVGGGQASLTWQRHSVSGSAAARRLAVAGVLAFCSRQRHGVLGLAAARCLEVGGSPVSPVS